MDPGLTEPNTTNPYDSEFPELSLHRTGSCSSSSSSDSSSEGNDFLQLDALGFGHPPEPPLHHPPQVPLCYDNGDPSLKPPVHPMPMAVRNDVPDPYRIPSSIFTRTKSTSPMEWSVASNESLFSIHMGNASFSRDPMFPNSRQDDQISFSGSSPIQDTYVSSISSQLPPLPPLAPVVLSTPMSLPPQLPVSSDSEMSSEAKEAVGPNAEAMKDVLLLEERESHKEKKSGPDRTNYSPSVSSKSDASISSVQSFAFPILTGNGTNRSIRQEPEHQNMQPKMIEQEKPKMTEASQTAQHVEPRPKAAPAKGGWFSCFSCCAGR